MTYNSTPLNTTVNLAFEEHGSGTPVLLLHGFPLNRRIWQEQVNGFSTSAHLILPDLRGHGASPAPEGAYSLDLMAQDVIQLLNRLDIPKAIWVGHSMGGYITMAAWRLAPERFSGMGLVATNHKADTPEAKAKRYETAEKVAAEGSKAALNPKLFHPAAPPNAPYIQATESIMLNTQPTGIMGALQALASRPDSSDTLKSVTVPTVVIGGEGDQLFKPEIPQEMARLVPNAVLTMIDAAGHMPMMETPSALNHALVELINQLA
ncbi:MAG: alpha/beta fold hydrolase [Anaerolineae bacterium]|nr:alpha/beta fold hydrolase [Anaerolineae bacterium]